MPSERDGAILHDLRALIGPASTAWDPVERSRCARDWWTQTLWWGPEELERRTPAAVAKPETAAEVAAVLDWAHRRGVAVVPRGGGSGVCGAAVPAGRDSLVLETVRLGRIGEFEAAGEEGIVRVEGGVFGGLLQEALAPRGYGLMHVPASLHISTVGGWIAAGSFGQLSTRYGGIGDQVEGVRVARPDGSLADVPPEEALSSEGTLGVIVEASLKVRRLSGEPLCLSCGFPGLAEGLSFLRALLDSGLRPAVARLYDPLEAASSGLKGSGGRWLGEGSRLALLSWLLGHAGAFGRLSRALPWRRDWLLVLVLEGSQAEEFAAIAERMRRERLRSFELAARNWLVKRFQWDTDKVTRLFERGCFVDTLDLWAPWDRLGGVYAGVLEAAASEAAAMGHVSHFDREGACLYMIIAGRGGSRTDSAEKHRRVWKAALDACVAAGGRVNHHHGIGLAKLPWARQAFRPGWLEEWSARKASLDPSGIMNPGKLLKGKA